MELLPSINQLLPLSTYEESYIFCFKLMILCTSFLALTLVSKEILSHFKFKQDQFEQEKLNSTLEQEMYFKVSQPLKYKELPIVKEMLGHEQVYSVFQSAQEKFENPN